MPIPTTAPAPGLPRAEWLQMLGDAFCDQLAERSDEVERKAGEAYGRCAARAAKDDAQGRRCDADASRLEALLARPKPVRVAPAAAPSASPAKGASTQGASIYGRLPAPVDGGVTR